MRERRGGSAAAGDAKPRGMRRSQSGGPPRLLIVGAIVIVSSVCAVVVLKTGGVRQKPLPKSSGRIPGCGDIDPVAHCAAWAKQGLCTTNGHVVSQCKGSCGFCQCEDRDPGCAAWASMGECDAHSDFMHLQCPVSCRLCQTEACHDKHEDCASRVRGTAASNFSNVGCFTVPGLRQACMWTCAACGLKSEPACARASDAPPAAKPGTIDAMFESLAAQRGASVLSSPASTGGPWVVTLDNFLTAEESDRLLEAARSEGLQRSLAANSKELEHRTSSTGWCKESCLKDPTVVEVQRRVEASTGVPVENAEFMQLLEYREGQFYKKHHDQDAPRASPWGPRLYTFFMYFGDDYVGGETHFPRLNITVRPSKGRALIWPHVLDSDPYERDSRTEHESLPMTSGIKYAANYWLHMYNFRAMLTKGCENVNLLENWM